MLKLSVLVLAAFIGICSATGPVHSIYFPEDNLLVCNVFNPRAGERDQPDFKPEEIPVLPFHITETTFLRRSFDGLTDIEVRGTYFAPVASGHQSPVLGEFSGHLRNKLLEEVGSLINSQLSDTGADLPGSRNEATAGQLIPLRYNTSSNTTGDIVIPTQSRVGEINETLDALGITNPVVRALVFRVTGELNRRCVPIGGWVRLPVGKFFPEWIYASFCRSDQTCSLPGGLICEPVVAADSIAHTVFLQWDCCWTWVGVEGEGAWVWECGWRKVRIAYLGRCHCGCGVVFDNLDGIYGYTGGTGDPSFVTDGREIPFVNNPAG